MTSFLDSACKMKKQRCSSASHPGSPTMWQDAVRGDESGIASGKVETPKYVEFRNVAASSFAGHLTCFGNHGSTMFLEM